MDGKSLRVDLSANLTLDEAVQINKKAQYLEGVSHIEDDGTVHFSPENMQIMKEVLGYECHRMTVEESYQCALELRAKYVAFAEHSHNYSELVGAC